MVVFHTATTTGHTASMTSIGASRQTQSSPNLIAQKFPLLTTTSRLLALAGSYEYYIWLSVHIVGQCHII